MNHTKDQAQHKKHQSDDVERRLAIPKQLLTISSSLTTALLAATVALYTFAPAGTSATLSAVAPARDEIVLGLLVVSFLFFIATTFSLGWCLYESIPAEKCIRLWGFSWRTSVPGSATMLIFSAALCAFLVLPTLVILPRVSELSWSWGPFLLGKPQLVRLSITLFFVFLFWQSIQEIVEPFVRKPRSAAGILYLLLLLVVAGTALLRPFLPWAASLGLAAMLFLVAVVAGWAKIAAQKRG